MLNGKWYENRHFSTTTTSISLYFDKEAQLLQRDRAMLRVTEYFAKSLTVIRNDTVE